MIIRLLLCGMAAGALVGQAHAADVPIVDFETPPVVVTYSGFATSSLKTDGGANSTSSYLHMIDAGWGGGWTMTNLASPPAAGNYKLKFFYRNGQVAAPMKGMTVGLVQSGSVKVDHSVPATAQTDWTELESAVFALSTDPVNIVISAQQSATIDVTADIDEIVLVPVDNAPLEISVFPDSRIYLSRTKTLVATPTFGSGTYTKVEFDVNNDSSIEHTATSAPFTFTWDTLVNVPQDTSRTLNVETSNTPIPVKVTVTDSNSNTAVQLLEYTVDNRFNGRESIVVNGDFSQWQTEGTGHDLPVGWVEQNTTTTLPNYGPVPGRDSAAGNALQVTFTLPLPTPGADPFPERYALRTVGVTGKFRDLQTYFWGLGDYCRLYYMKSEDNGVTYITTQQSAGEANSATWKLAVQAAPKNLGLADTNYIALGTHQLSTAANYWDDIVSEGIKLPVTSDVDGWKLY